MPENDAPARDPRRAGHVPRLDRRRGDRAAPARAAAGPALLPLLMAARPSSRSCSPTALPGRRLRALGRARGGGRRRGSARTASPAFLAGRLRPSPRAEAALRVAAAARGRARDDVAALAARSTSRRRALPEPAAARPRPPPRRAAAAHGAARVWPDDATLGRLPRDARAHAAARSRSASSAPAAGLDDREVATRRRCYDDAATVATRRAEAARRRPGADRRAGSPSSRPRSTRSRASVAADAARRRRAAAGRRRRARARRRSPTPPEGAPLCHLSARCGSASAARSARARAPSSRRSAARSGDVVGRRRDERHLHDRGRARSCGATGVLPPSGSSPSRPAAARTPRSATTSRRTSRPSRSSSATQGPLDLVLVESGGDNLTAIFSPALADVQIFVIDVAGGDDIPRKGGPGIARADLLVINKDDLAPLVGSDVERMLRRRARRGAASCRSLALVAPQPPHARAGRRLGARAGRARSRAARRAPALERRRGIASAPRPRPRHALRRGAAAGRCSVRRASAAAATHADRAAPRDAPRAARARTAAGVVRAALVPTQAGPLAGDARPRADRRRRRARRSSSSRSPRRSRCPAPRGIVPARCDVAVGAGGRLVLDEAPLILAAGADVERRVHDRARGRARRRVARDASSSAATARRPAARQRPAGVRPAALLHDGLRVGPASGDADAHVALAPGHRVLGMTCLLGARPAEEDDDAVMALAAGGALRRAAGPGTAAVDAALECVWAAWTARALARLTTRRRARAGGARR